MIPNGLGDGNILLREFDIQDLTETFEKFGCVAKVIILPYPNSHIAFVEMESPIEAFYAKEALEK